jgi:hypothetical protein
MKPTLFVFKSIYEEYQIPLPTSQTSTDNKGALRVESLNSGQIIFKKYEYRTTDENIAAYIRESKWFKKKEIIELTAAFASGTKQEPKKTNPNLTPVHGAVTRNDIIGVLVGPPYSVLAEDIKEKSLDELKDFARKTFSIDFVDANDGGAKTADPGTGEKKEKKEKSGKVNGKKKNSPSETQQ